MLFELAHSLRSLTRSPITAALNEARKMARPHLETGGTAAPTHKRAHHYPEAAAFLVPPDVDAVAFSQAIRAKLGDGDTGDALYPLQQKKLGGTVVLRLPGRHILRLKDGRYDLGRAFLHGLVKD